LLVLYRDKKIYTKNILLENVHTSIRLLLSQLLNEKLEDTRNLKKAINTIIVEIIEHCDISFVFIVLFKELRESITVIPTNDKIPLYSQLILKCLSLSSKRLESLPPDYLIDYSKILKEIHLFYLQHPLNQWRKSSDNSINDYIKTFLNSLIQLKKSVILRYLTFFGTSQNFHDLYIIIDKLLHKNGLPSRRVEISLLVRYSHYGPLDNDIEKVELVKILTNLYRTIFHKDTCLQGLADLVVLRHCNPSLPIDKYIESTAPKLREFVEKGLKKFDDLNIDFLRNSSDTAFNLSTQPCLYPSNLAMIQLNERSSLKAEELVKTMRAKLSLPNL